jgi:hypothetical protein
MMNLLAIRKSPFLSEESRIAFILTVILTCLFVSIVFLFGGKAIAVALFPLVVVFMFLTLNYDLSLWMIVIILFIDVHISFYSSAVWSSIPLGIAFLLKYKDVQWREFANPLTIPIVVYGICILPSFLNALEPFTSLLKLFNVAAFLIVMYSIVAGIHSYDTMCKLVIIYLCFVLLNSLDVFRLTWLGEKRPFGFAGVMFVDYSALGLCVSATLAIISQGIKRVLFLSSSFLMLSALLLTQTRNTWLSAIITLCLLIGYLFFHPELFGFSHKRVVTISSIGMLMMAGVVILTLSYNPLIEQRAIDLTNKTKSGIDEWGNTGSSMVTRLFIWDTALNAFLAHPLAGIGVYAFPYSSQYYYRFSRPLYEKYVKGLSPHQTHFAVLAETGIIGFCGFLIFVVAALKYAIRSIQQTKGERGKRYALVGAVATVYCMISMVFTDAWLWGQGIVLLGLVLGLMLVNRKIASENIPSS